MQLINQSPGGFATAGGFASDIDYSIKISVLEHTYDMQKLLNASKFR